MPTVTSRIAAIAIAAAALGIISPSIASAGIVLSQVVIDITPDSDVAQDIEVRNDANEVAYVVVEPSEIASPGLAGETRTAIVDPGVGGLLATPQRMILQPGERKMIRIAAVASRGTVDRIYRVVVKPVAGPVTAQVSALKLLVGYDVLVIYRPATLSPGVAGVRTGETLTLRNTGNTNVEIFEGKQCSKSVPTECKDLPSKRLYAGQSWQQSVASDRTVTYRVAVGKNSTLQGF